MPRSDSTNLSARRRKLLELERDIGNLTHRFLSSIDHHESQNLAADLIAAIRELVDRRSDGV